MADRRDESRLDALRRRVSKLRDDDGPDGVDARTRGKNRSAVDARRTEVDEEAVAAAGEGEFEGVPIADASKPRSRVAKARARVAEALQDRADSESVKAAAKKTLEGIATDEGAPSRAPGTTGTQTEEIAQRATDAAEIRSPMGGSLRTIGDERVVTDMARAAAAEDDELLTGAGLSFESVETGRSRRAASDPEFVGMGVGFEMEDADDDDEMRVDDPFGLTGAVADDPDDEDDDPFPGIQLTGGDE